MPALAGPVSRIFDKVAALDCVSDYLLVGGTALSLQLQTRLSEDLDFMQWKPSGKREVDWVGIKKELETVGAVQSVEVLEFFHVLFVVDEVKISFYCVDKVSPVTNPVPISANLRAADLLAIAAMKMEVLMRRAAFRDYYDIYSLFKQGVDLNDAIELALKYSKHQMKRKNLLAILCNGNRFLKSDDFQLLLPVYDVTADEIAAFMSDKMEKFTFKRSDSV